MNENSIFNGYKKRRKRYVSVTSLLVLLVFALCVFMLVYGNTIYSISDVVNVLSGQEIKGATFAISKVRLPRMLAGVLVGIAFGVAGNTFQTMLRNPLASPDIIGITSGCSVAAVYSILILGLSGQIVSIISLVSGLSVAMLIYFLARGSSFSGGRLILIGIGMQAFINAIISSILLKANEYEVSSAIRWLNGSLNGISMKPIPTLFLVVVVFTSLNIVLTKHLQVLELGDELAVTLGVNVNVTRIALIITSVFLIAYATSVTGPISFVAFLSAPIASRIVGNGSPRVLAAGLVGAVLVLSGDLIGQFLFSSRFPVGVVTGILGGPYMLFLLIRLNKRGGVK